MVKDKDTYCEFKALTQKIAEFKRQNHLTYQQIAEAVGVDKSHVHRVVNMETSPSLKFLLRLSRFMQLPLYSLFIPTESIVAKDISQNIKEGLVKLNKDLGFLEGQVNIPPLRLMDIVKGNLVPTHEEYNEIARVLDLEEEEWIDSTEVKLNLIRSTLLDLSLKEDQVDNILDYINNIIG